VKNEDKKIQALFKTENFMQRDDMQNYEGLEEDLKNLSDDDHETHLTIHDYEMSLDIEPLFSNEESINNLGESAYQGIVESIMVELQKKYNLRPREINPTSVPTKKILSRNKENEAVVTKPLVETQVAQTKKLKQEKHKLRRLRIAKHKLQPDKLKKQLEVLVYKMN
jgi:hypothetical protein